MKEAQEMWIQSLGKKDPVELENGNLFQYSYLANGSSAEQGLNIPRLTSQPI